MIVRSSDFDFRSCVERLCELMGQGRYRTPEFRRCLLTIFSQLLSKAADCDCNPGDAILGSAYGSDQTAFDHARVLLGTINADQAPLGRACPEWFSSNWSGAIEDANVSREFLSTGGVWKYCLEAISRYVVSSLDFNSIEEFIVETIRETLSLCDCPSAA